MVGRALLKVIQSQQDTSCSSVMRRIQPFMLLYLIWMHEESMNDMQNSDSENKKSVEHVEQQSKKRKMEEVVEMDE